MSSLGGWITAHKSIQGKCDKKGKESNQIFTKTRKKTVLNVSEKETKISRANEEATNLLNNTRDTKNKDLFNKRKTNNFNIFSVPNKILSSTSLKQQNTVESIQLKKVKGNHVKEIKVPKRSREGDFHLHCKHWASSPESAITGEMAAWHTQIRIKEAKNENNKNQDRTTGKHQRRIADYRQINKSIGANVVTPSSNEGGDKKHQRSYGKIMQKATKIDQVAVMGEQKRERYEERDNKLSMEKDVIDYLEEEDVSFSSLNEKAADASSTAVGDMELRAASSKSIVRATTKLKATKAELSSSFSGTNRKVERVDQKQGIYTISNYDTTEKENCLISTNKNSRPLNFTAKLRTNLYCKKKAEAAEKKRRAEEQQKEKLQELFRRSQEQVAKAAGYTLARGSYKLSEYNKEKSRGLFSKNPKQEHMYIVKQHADLMWKSQFVNG